MAVENLNFQGINRAISDYSPSSACEELINLRPTTAGLVPVKGCTVSMSGVTYDRVYIHNASNATNYLAVKSVSGHIYIYHITAAGVISTTLADITTSTTIPASAIHFAYAGNVIIFSIADNSLYKNASYTWNGTEYKETEAQIPQLDVQIDEGTITMKQSSYLSFSTDSKREAADVISNGFNEIQSTNPAMCFGTFIMAIVFKTESGNSFVTGKWKIEVCQPGPTDTFLRSARYAYRATSSDAPNSTAFFSTHGDYGYRGFYISDTDWDSRTFTGNSILGGKTITVRIDLATGATWNEDSSIIKSVEVYASRPKLYPSVEAMLDSSLDSIEYHRDAPFFLLPATKYSEMDLGGEQLYHMGSVSMRDIASGEQSVSLSFGGNAQVANATLEVDAGAVQRFGNVFAYNARFHFYDSVASREIPMPEFIMPDVPSDATDRTFRVFVTYNDGMKDSLVYLGTKSLPATAYIKFIIATPIGVREVILYDGSNLVQHYPVYTFIMTASGTNNFSLWAEGDGVNGYLTYGQETKYTSPGAARSYIVTQEQSAINVSEQYEPLVFEVDHSYLAPGKVLDIRPQMVAIQGVSFGDYPLNVWTDRGLYALLQGSANVLYGAFRPIASHVINGKAIPTPQGTFFLSDGGLWLVAGVNTVLVSDALHLGPHKYIRDDTDGYVKLCKSSAGYDISGLESAVEFKTFTTATTGSISLSYNRYRDEIIVSNSDYDYSYVLSLKYRQWFKIGRCIWQDEPGSNIANTPNATSGTDIINFTDETNDAVLVHLQSRPFTIGTMYSHVHRLVALVRSKLPSNARLIVALYGSDNLQDWTLLSYSARSGSAEQGAGGTTVEKPLKLSQVRTPSAARSWRYYTITIGGKNIPVDTDFGSVLMDYEQVARRIG